MARILPFFLFFVSGWCSLVYEVIWSRMLVLVLGNTTLATTTILAAFMLGLSLGSFYWGRWIEHHPDRPLFTFGCLELGVGLFAVTSCYLIKAIIPLETMLFSPTTIADVSNAGIRFLLCVSLLFVPTFLMGGTLAVLAKKTVFSSDCFGRRVALLYGVNTFGAVFGALCAGFFMVEYFGHKNAVLFAAGLNCLIAAVAVFTDWQPASLKKRLSDADQSVSKDTQPCINGPAWLISTAVLAALFISGFCAMAYQVLWTRLLILIIDNSIYSFTIILVGFLVGIALGGFICWQAFRFVSNYILMFAWVQAGIGVTAFMLPFFIVYGTEGGSKTYIRFLFSTLPFWLFFPTTLMGMILPIGASIFQNVKKTVGASLGFAYGVNTFGAVCGAWVAGFFLIGKLGFRNSFLLLSMAGIIVSVMFFFLSLGKKHQTVLSLCSMCLIAVIIGTVAVHQMPENYFSKKYSALEPDSSLLYYKESISTTATIFQRSNRTRSLYLNGIAEVDSSLLSMKTFRLMGALPGLLHPEPENGLMVTFGAGITSATAAYFVEKLDCVDLSNQASLIGPHFKFENEDIIKNSKFSIYTDDARHFLQNTNNTYAFIVSDATHPRVYDSWVLFTTEFYELVKKRLKKEGIFLQWVPFHGMETAKYQAIVRTFQTTFPHTSIWSIQGAYSLLLATSERLSIDFERLNKRLFRRDLREHLKGVGLENPFELLSYFMMGEDNVKKFVGEAFFVITDNSPHHLFFPFRSTFEEQYRKWPVESYKMLQRHTESVIPFLVNIGNSNPAQILNSIRYYERLKK